MTATTATAITVESDSSLLDSDVEDIPVPILQPKSGMSQTADEVQATNMALLDRRLEHLSVPVLEPGRTMLLVCAKEEDEVDASLFKQNFLSREHISNLWVFQYGLRYIPATKEVNSHRTVRIEELPADTTLNRVLLIIRGEIYSSRLLDTMAIAGYNTVIIVFAQERDARSLIQNARKGLRVGSSVAKVTLVNTPTYPMPPGIDELIKKGYSRCLVVSNLNRTNQVSLCHVLQRSAYYPYMERISAGPSTGEASIRFHSIKPAVAVCSLLKGHPILWNCAVSFLEESGGKWVRAKAE